MSSRMSTRLAVVRPTRRGYSRDWRRPAVRNRGVCGSTFSNTRCARITSRSLRSGRTRKHSTRTPPPCTPGSTATGCSRSPVALSMSACTSPLNSSSLGVMVHRIFAFGLLLLWQPVALAAQTERWPEFRGPTGQGHSTERDVPLEWSESRNVLWKTQVQGRGWSSPVVEGDRVWLTTAISARSGTSLRAMAFDVETGREVVNVEVFHLGDSDLLNAKNSHASPTPIVEGDRVYVHFGSSGTAALTKSGEVVWKTRLSYQSQHGNGGSPVLYKDLLIVSCDGSDTAFVVALDKRTGKVRWKTPRRRPISQ